MSIKIGYAIFNSVWLIEPAAGNALLSHWLETRSNPQISSYKEDGDQNEPVKKKDLFARENVIMAPASTWGMNKFDGFNGATVAVIPLMGVMMKSDYCGAMGTDTITNLVNLASNTPSVKTIVMAIDSPGGQVNGTENLANALKSSLKKTIAVADGYMCSAAYWVGSSCNEVYASVKTATIGSVGTMISWYDNSKALEDRGYVLREYYATDSKDKNAAFREANKGDGKRLIVESLDPTNHEFTSAVQQNRPNINKEKALSGSTYMSTQAIQYGMIDGVKPLNQVIAEAAALTPKPQAPKSKISNMKVFQRALAVANAESFAVVDGGLMLTEDQLTAIDTQLSQDKTVIKGLSDQLQALQGSTTSAADLKAAQDKATDLQTKLDAALAAKATAEADLETEKKKPGGQFASTTSKKSDPEPEADEDAAKIEAMNKKHLEASGKGYF